MNISKEQLRTYARDKRWDVFSKAAFECKDSKSRHELFVLGVEEGLFTVDENFKLIPVLKTA